MPRGGDIKKKKRAGLRQYEIFARLIPQRWLTFLREGSYCSTSSLPCDAGLSEGGFVFLKTGLVFFNCWSNENTSPLPTELVSLH